MAITGDALRKAFMPKHEYQSLREEEKAWHSLQKPLNLISVTLISLAIFISSAISMSIVFPADNLRRPFCRDVRIQPLSINFTAQTAASGDGRGGGESDPDLLPGAFVLTDQETVDYYWMVVFVPSAMGFVAFVGLLDCRFLKRMISVKQTVYQCFHQMHLGGVDCLSILNIAFTIVFGLLVLFLGSTLLTLGSSFSVALIWC